MLYHSTLSDTSSDSPPAQHQYICKEILCNPNVFLSFYTPFFLSLGSFRVKTRITTVFNTVFTTVADLDFWERILFRHFKPSGTKNKSFQIYNTYRDHLFVLCTFFKLFYSFRSVNARPYPDLPGSLSKGILICPDPYLTGF